MLRKAVIPAAGSGLRLLPATKEQPKEMLPIFTKGFNGVVCIKPFVQLVFEQLYDAGFKDLCFVVGRGKRSIEDQFTLNDVLMERLSRRNNFELAQELNNFYHKINQTSISFVNQSEPKGFGDAVFHARSFTRGEPFLVHAGDDLIISEENQYLRRLVRVFERKTADAVFYVQRVADARKYGVISGKKVAPNLYKVTNVEEKPISPPSNIAIVAVYAFSDRIYDAIERTPPDSNNEIQLTNAIKNLIDERLPVYALELKDGEKRIDIGTPKSYWEVLKAAKRLLAQETHHFGADSNS